ncbi:MAG: IS66 family insertion sequence element accessory protein TnpB [Oligoflexales bacterium]
MKPLISFLKLHLYRPFVDMRKQASGLAELTEEVKLCHPLSCEVFIFCNKRRSLLKAIYWD